MVTHELDVDALLRTINECHQLDLHLTGRFRDGENQGAYAVADPSGRQFVLKRRAATSATRSRLVRAASITECLQPLGYPAPQYLLIGTAPEGDLYCIQEALPSGPIGRLTEPHQVARLLELNDLRAGRAISLEQDWTAYATDVVFHDASGWAAGRRSCR